MQPDNDLKQIPASRQAILRSGKFMMIQLTDCDVWASRADRKIFDFQWVAKHGDDELRRQIDAPNHQGTWMMFFDGPLPRDLDRRVERVIG